MGNAQGYTLIADIGGTQARLGLARDGVVLHDSVIRYKVGEFTSLYEVITVYFRAEKRSPINGCVIATAGVILDGQVKLTNSNWSVSLKELQALCNTHSVILINDLASHGYALAGLDDGTLIKLNEKPTIKQETQALVIGIGTGFNVCPVYFDQNGFVQCLASELGHAALPSSLMGYLSQHMDNTQQFVTFENIFSGQGLYALYKAMGGVEALTSRAVSAGNITKNDPEAERTLKLFIRLLALALREIILQYLPSGGIYFSGSVARSIFTPELSPLFFQMLYGDGHFVKNINTIPLRVIANDGVGLIGCAIVAKQKF